MTRVSFALALVASVAIAAPAVAADMYGGNRAPVASNYGYQDQGGYSSSNPWSGAYVGGQLGYGWGDGSKKGAVGGVYGGVNAGLGSNVVVGAEADVNASGLSHDGVLGGSVVEKRSDWNGSIRARVGVAYDRVMPYATAGIALADDSVKYNGATSSTTKVGYALGAGVEGRVVDHVTAKGELIYEGFGDTTHSAGPYRTTNNVSQTHLRAGVAYHF